MYSEEHGETLIDQNRNPVTFQGWKQDTMVRCDRVPKQIRQQDVQCQRQRHEIHVSAGKDPITNNLPSDLEQSEKPSFTKLKNFNREKSHEDTVETMPATESEDEEDIVIFDDEVEEKQDCQSKESIQKRVCLVKLYAWIKEEMSKTAAKSVASYLYQDEQKLLSRSDHESICHCSWRRDAVEQLLKKVLMGPSDIHDVFLKALKEQEERHIAERLVNTHATESEIEVFTSLEQSSLQHCLRPHSHEPRFTISSSDDQTLLYYLNNKNTIDSVNDNFLSRFIFSIREHTNMCLCTLDDEKRVRLLIQTMKLCSDKTFEDLCEILSSIEMGHVIRKLERRKQGETITCKQRQKRKSSPIEESPQNSTGVVEEPSTSTVAKRRCVNSSIECRLVSSMQRSSSVLQHALDQLGFDVENVNNGSIVIQLCPKQPDSWRKLEENCRSGKIKDFIPVVYNNGAIADLLQEGEYRLQFTIYTLPVPDDTQEENKKVLFHLETEHEKPEDVVESKSSHHDNLIEDHMDLLCEELEISPDLLSILKKEKLVEQNIKQDMDKQGSRAKKIKYLMKQIGSHGAKGYDVLKEYIKDNNEDLYKELSTREEVKVIDSKIDHAKVTKRPSSSGSSHRAVYKKEVFFTGTVVLNVKKHASDKTKENISPDSSQSELEISCPEIINPVCHFQMKGKEKSQKSGEVTIVLEEAWAPVGQGQGQGREILIGKRKSRDKKPADEVKLSNKRVHSTEEEPDDVDDVDDTDTDLKKETAEKLDKTAKSDEEVKNEAKVTKNGDDGKKTTKGGKKS